MSSRVRTRREMGWGIPDAVLIPTRCHRVYLDVLGKAPQHGAMPSLISFRSFLHGGPLQTRFVLDSVFRLLV